VLVHAAARWHPREVNLLGAQPIEVKAPEPVTVFPSDHFGVWYGSRVSGMGIGPVLTMSLHLFLGVVL